MTARAHILYRSMPLGLALLACARGAPEPIAISLQHRPCFGRCPTYTLMLTRSGSAARHGEQWTSFVGHYQAAFDTRVFDDLSSFIASEGFESLDTAYVSPITDLADTITCVHWTTHMRCIRDYGGAGPAALSSIETAIDLIGARL